MDETDDLNLIYKDYDKEVIEHLQEVLLEMFKDFIKICNNNNIKYFLHGGTNIGAVRHNGFIPWDDEIDVALLREDYEKLIKILDKPNEKYYICNWKKKFNINDSNYTQKTLFCLKNTKVKMNKIKCGGFVNITGIYIDLNVLDDIPENKIEKFLFIKMMDLINFLIVICDTIRCDRYGSKFREKIGRFFRFLSKYFNIANFAAKLFTKLIKRYQGKCGTVCSIGAEHYDKAIPKKYFDKITLVKFEDIYVNMLEDYDKVLSVYYEDYMELPPENERFNHDWEIDFGDY